jgi:hypothetical protein
MPGGMADAMRIQFVTVSGFSTMERGLGGLKVASRLQKKRCVNAGYTLQKPCLA